MMLIKVTLLLGIAHYIKMSGMFAMKMLRTIVRAKALATLRLVMRLKNMTLPRIRFIHQNAQYSRNVIDTEVVSSYFSSDP